MAKGGFYIKIYFYKKFVYQPKLQSIYNWNNQIHNLELSVPACYVTQLLPAVVSLPAMALYRGNQGSTVEPQNLWHWVTHPEFAAGSLKKCPKRQVIQCGKPDRLVMHQVLGFPSSS